MNLVSFDIFDTTLFRTCGLPENVFYIVGLELFPNDRERQKLFYDWRLKAEKNAQLRFKKEVSIYEIYDDESISVLCEKTQTDLVRIELETENRVLKSNPLIFDKIIEYREKGFQIAFISDMYLPSDFLKEILTKEGIYNSNDQIYVSNEYQARKSNGSLYSYVKKRIKPKQWLHYGDNQQSDIKEAKKYGIKAYWINTEYNKTEKTLIEHTHNLLFKSECSILSGLTRYLRLSSKDSFDIFAAEFVVPSYLSYLFYLKDIVEREKINKLYFLSRDSYILMKGFESLSLPINSSFFFASRKSLLLPYYFISTKENFCDIYRDHTLVGKNACDILNSLKVEKDEICNLTANLNHGMIENKEQENVFLSLLFESHFSTNLRSTAKDEYNLFVSYMKQEGVTDENMSAIVDVGWLGSSRLMINRILDSINASRVKFIYYSVLDSVFPVTCGEFFYYKQVNGPMTNYVEQYFSDCPYPTTIGYHEKEGRIEPTFPLNEIFYESKVYKSNVKQLTHALNLYSSFFINSTDALFLWSQNVDDSLINCSENIDYSVILIPEIDKHEKPITRKMTKMESIKFLLGIRSKIKMEKVSAVLTFGYSFIDNYWPIAMFLRRSRKKIERCLGRNKAM